MPKKQFGWFDESTSVFKFDTRPTPTPEYVGDCTDCPSRAAPAKPGTPSPAASSRPRRRARRLRTAWRAANFGDDVE